MANYANPVSAVLAYLLAQPDITTLVGTRAYATDLPAALSAGMPVAVIVVDLVSGGSVGAHYRSDIRPRIEVRTYAVDKLEAYKLHMHIYDALQTLGLDGREIWANTLLQSAVCTSQPDYDLEKIGSYGWPYFSSLWLLASDYLPVS